MPLTAGSRLGPYEVMSTRSSRPRSSFDRLIVSACRVVKARLATKDEGLQTTGLVQTVWN